MITLFNRKELMVTYNFREVSEIREILLVNRIEHQVKASYPRSPFVTPAGRTRTAYFDPFRQQERYTIYVHKSDYDHAMYLLQINR